MKHSPSSHPSINIIHHEDDIFHPSIDSKPHLSIKCHLLMGMKLIFIHPWRGTEAKLLAARPACEALLLCLLRRLMFSAPEQIWLLELERELLLISISYSIAREREREKDVGYGTLRLMPWSAGSLPSLSFFLSHSISWIFLTHWCSRRGLMFRVVNMCSSPPHLSFFRRLFSEA